MPARSSAQRAFSQKWLIGIVTSRAVTARASHSAAARARRSLVGGEQALQLGAQPRWVVHRGRERERRAVVAELALGGTTAAGPRVAQDGDLVGQRDVDDGRSGRVDLLAQRALAPRVLADRGVFGQRHHHAGGVVAEGGEDVVAVAVGVLDDVVQQADELQRLVVAVLAQHVGDGARVLQALAGRRRDAVVGLVEERERGGARGLEPGDGAGHAGVLANRRRRPPAGQNGSGEWLPPSAAMSASTGQVNATARTSSPSAARRRPVTAQTVAVADAASASTATTSCQLSCHGCASQTSSHSPSETHNTTAPSAAAHDASAAAVRATTTPTGARAARAASGSRVVVATIMAAATLPPPSHAAERRAGTIAANTL